MNVSATFSIFKLLRDPALCLPHSTVSTFNHLPIPLSKAFVKQHGEKEVDIRAVVLDKDNCFATPQRYEVHNDYKVQIPNYPTSTSALPNGHFTKHMLRSRKTFGVAFSYDRMMIQTVLIVSDSFLLRPSSPNYAKPTRALAS